MRAELEKLAADTFRHFRLLAANTKAIAALSLWNDAVQAQKWAEEKLAEARQLILAGVSSGRRRKRRS